MKRHSIKGLSIKKDPIKEVSGLSHLPGLQAGQSLRSRRQPHTVGLDPQAFIDQRLIGMQSALSPGGWVSSCTDVSGSDLIAGPDCHLLSNDRVGFARNCD